MHVHNTSSRPGLFLSARPEFLERGQVFNQKLSRGGPSKKRVSIFFTKLLHRPGPLTLMLIRLNQFFLVGKKRNLSNRFFAIFLIFANFCVFLRLFARESN